VRIDTRMTPFRYIANMTISLTDPFTCTPIMLETNVRR
jgi:hypothetical protein